MTTLSNNKGSRGEWETPKDLLRECIEYAGFEPDIDVAASEHNALYRLYLTEEINMLYVDWVDMGGSKFWLNPPNRLLARMLNKAYRTWLMHNMAGIMILPLQSMGTSYVKEIWKHIEDGSIRFRPIWKRPRFELNGEIPIINGKKATSSPFAYCMLVFDKRKE